MQREEEAGTDPGNLSYEVSKSKLFSTNPHLQKMGQIHKYIHKSAGSICRHMPKYLDLEVEHLLSEKAIF